MTVFQIDAEGKTSPLAGIANAGHDLFLAANAHVFLTSMAFLCQKMRQIGKMVRRPTVPTFDVDRQGAF